MENAQPKYPILLVHGLGLRDDHRLLKYWGKLPQFLEERGVKVFLSGQDAVGSVSHNALQLRERIAYLRAETGAEKFNLIAHSKGGLDSREALLDATCASHVASLITLSTPHHGSAVVDELGKKLPKSLVNTGMRFADYYYRLSGDKEPNSAAACEGLLPELCEIRNEAQNELPGIFVRSFAASYKARSFYRPYYRSSRLVSRLEGENDGLVSERSARWQGYAGMLKSASGTGVSHVVLNGRKGLDYPVALEGTDIATVADFYLMLLGLLAENGC